MTFLIDSHCHLGSLSLNGKAADSIEQIIARAQSCKVSHFLSVACTTAEFSAMQQLLSAYPYIYYACGVHPLSLKEAEDWTEEELRQCLSCEKVLALGETGLDYHYAPESRKAQIASFARQIDLAVSLKKPLIVHAREAKDDTLNLLISEQARDCGGVIHCFTDTVDMARKCLDLGFYISFTGIATFKGSDNVREVIKYMPLDRLMVETDCPYLAPIPVRGIENEPAFVRYVLKFIADFKGISEETLAEITSRNFQELYGVTLKEPDRLECLHSNYKIEQIAERPFERSI